jgi:hypothetical protein
MSAISSTAALSTPQAKSRILAVTRLHYVNRFQFVYQPLIILGGIFVLNLAIWLIIIDATPVGDRRVSEAHLSYSGAVFYIYVYALVIAVQAVARTFPFSLGFGVTRRNFSLGSAIAFALLAVIFAVVLTIMSAIEIATHGWGIGGYMFAPTYFTTRSWPLRFVMYLLPLLFCLFLGSAAASVWVRWKLTGLIVFFAILAIILLGTVAILTLGDHWGEFGDWLGATGLLGALLWLLVPTAVCALAGFVILRRATPKG